MSGQSGNTRAALSPVLRSPFFLRLAVVALSLILGFALLSGWFWYRAAVSELRSNAVQSLGWQVMLARETLERSPGEEGSLAEHTQRVLSLSDNTGNRFTLIDADGSVLADSVESPASMDNQLQRLEIARARQRGEGIVSRTSVQSGGRYHFHALPLYRGGEIIGYIRGGLSEAGLAADVREMLSSALLPGVLLLLAVCSLALWFCYGLAWRVQRMTGAAKTIADGNFVERIPTHAGSGLDPLARAINELARSSAARVSEVTADRNRLAAIFAGMVEGVIDVDQHQQIQHINDAAARLLGISSRGSLKRPLWQEIRIKAITDALDRAMLTRDVVKSQMRLTRDRDELVVDIHAASLSNSAGDPMGAVIVLNDITEVENLSRVRTDFVANASHELKTPITAIRGLAETVLNDRQMEQESLMGFVGRIHSQSLRLSQLVSDLMAISRLESSQQEQVFAPVNLSLLVRQAVHAAQPLLEAKKQALQSGLPDEQLKLMGDRQNLSQLLDNLIDNAIKYTPEGGSISVSLEREEDEAVLRVQDDGIGISHQYQQRIFERFYRVDKVRSQSLGGTGLGLSIVKNIVEKHGGTISLDSQLGSGSTFTVRLPLGA